MATLHHNISGTTTAQLLAAGDAKRVSKISLCNTSSSNSVSIDLYIEKVGLGKFNLLDSLAIPTGTTFIYEGVSFNNSKGEFGLYITCTGTSPLVDVIIS